MTFGKTALMIMAASTILITASCEKAEETTAMKLDTPVPSLTGVSRNSATVQWEAVPGAESYMYILDLEKGVTTTDTKAVFDGLTPETEYTVKLKAVSPAGEEYDSEWAAFAFTTSDKEAPTFTINEIQVLPTEFTVEILPSDKDITYYVEKNTEQQWAQWIDDDGNFHPEMLMEYELEYINIFVTPYNPITSVLPNFLVSGDQTLTFSKNIEPDSRSYIYVFGWNPDGTFTSDLFWKEIHTPPLTDSELNVDISFSGVTDRDMTVVIEPEPGIAKYHITFSYTDVIEGALPDGDEAALEELILGVLEDGTPCTGRYEQHRIVDPDEDYTVCVAGYDEDGGRFFKMASQKSLPRPNPDDIDSPLFDQLIGSTWSGQQRLMTANGETITAFTATIEATESDMNYRDYNELVIKLNGYAGIAYQSVEDLYLYGYSRRDAFKIYGPKLIMAIGEDGDMTIDVSEYQASVMVNNYGYIYAKGYNGTEVSDNNTLTVTLSEDGNTMTISDDSEGYYPTLMLYNDGWTPYTLSLDNMTMTRID